MSCGQNRLHLSGAWTLVVIGVYLIEIACGEKQQAFKCGQKIYIKGKDQLSWMEAYHSCARMGMTLLTDLAQHIGLRCLKNNAKYLSSKKRNERNDFWTSATRQGHNTWMWMSLGKVFGTSAQIITSISESDCPKDCLAIIENVKTNNWEWQAEHCNEPKFYICESA